jgi:hypothetical protein
MSAEIRLMLWPRGTYAALARAPQRGTLLAALRRPALVALVIGVAVAISTTRHVTPALLLSTTLCWLFVVVLQGGIGLALMAGPARRTVGINRAVDLYFAGHAPWSLWLLAAAAWGPSPVGRPAIPVAIAAAVPLLLTPRIVAAFFREVLELEPRHAWARAAAQQVLTWAAFGVLFAVAVAWLPRVLEWFE